MAFMDEVVNTVNFVEYTKLQSPEIFRLYVPPPFVVTGTPILHYAVV